MSYFQKITSYIILRKSISNAEKQKNLNEIDLKIKSLIEKCRSKGMSDEQIANIGLQVLRPSIYGSNIVKNMLKILAFFVLIGGIVRIEPLNRLTCMYGRLLLFEIEPYWNWNIWYSSSCLMNNPFYVSKSFSERECYFCEDIIAIERRDDLNTEIIAEKYIRNEIPLIIDSKLIRYEINKWPIANKSFYLQDLDKIYENDDWKNVCMFQTNIKTNDHLTFIKKIQTKSYSDIGWYAHWENCDKKTEKQLRKYYIRPTILPSMIELTKSNWIVVSHNFVAKNCKKIDPSAGTQLILMIQVKGSNYIRLEPKELCAQLGCNTIDATLYENDLILFSANLWNLCYSPRIDENSSLNLALLIGGIYE